MHQIAMMMAGMMPKEDLIEQLEDSINEWKVNPSDDNWHKLSVVTALINARNVIDQNGGEMEGVVKTVTDLEKFQREKELFNPKQN